MKTLLLPALCYFLCATAFKLPAYASESATYGVSAGPSTPQPFGFDQDWPTDKPAISTGYYLVDSESKAATTLGPNPATLFVDTTVDRSSWHRIVSGPRQFPLTHWDSFSEGHKYFRNPGDIDDSTDNAFAGPIRIGFPFYFNGVRYDSFYVSSNMLIALSNRRYFYENGTGIRRIGGDNGDAWDRQSDDTRERQDPFNEKGLRDPVADDWGYRMVACGGDPSKPLLGIRNPANGALDEFSNDAPIIAPAWDDWQLSQYNDELKQKEDRGQVWYRRHADNSKLTIYFLHIQPIGSKTNPLNTDEKLAFRANNRVGVDQLSYELAAQVTLDAADSSLSFLYKVVRPALMVVNNRPVATGSFVEHNATIGVRGQARYRDKEGEVRSYTQSTEYLRNGLRFVNRRGAANTSLLHSDFAIRFKQYKNLLRVADIDFMVKDPASNEYTVRIDEPDNYELLAGNPLLGAIRPVVLYQNLSNDIQGAVGINYQAQDINFRARFQIINEIHESGTVYNKDVCIDSFALANSSVSGVRLVDIDRNSVAFKGKGIPPYAFVEVSFPAYETSVFLEKMIGRLTAAAFAETVSCDKAENYGDQWPYDDTLACRFFGLKVLKSFSDFVSDFSYSRREGLLPSVNKWVSRGAEVVDGIANTYNPPPPHDEVSPEGEGSITLRAPVLRLDRVDEEGREGEANGDELRSFPIDLRGTESAVLSFSYQRAGRPPSGDWPRGWSDQSLYGPEPRVIRDANPLVTMQNPDLLEVHFKNPSPDRFKNIVNVPDDGWSAHPLLNDPDKFITDNPAWTVFGGGGYRRAFAHNNPDSAITRDEGLVSDIFDDGKDWEFNKVFLPIPNYLLDAANDGAGSFRFKFAVKARANGSSNLPIDDFDPFYIDNVQILKPTETPDLEVELVRAVWPYSMVPASQAQKIPLEVKLANNSNIPSRAFAVRLQIRDHGRDLGSYLLYERTMTLPFIRALTETRVAFPTWNARQTRPGRYTLAAFLRIPGGDPVEVNDLSEGDFTLNFGNAMAYDPPTLRGRNDVPNFAGHTGKGLNLTGFNSGEAGGDIPYGPDGGNATGELAMKFSLSVSDTLYGYQAYFGDLSRETIGIAFALYRENSGRPDPLVPGSRIIKQRGVFDIDANGKRATPGDDPKFNEYAVYLLPDSLILAPGTYWMSVAQLGSEGIELGASSARMGMVTTNYSDKPRLGVNGTSLVIDKQLRERNGGGQLVNSSLFAYKDLFATPSWHQFTPNIGNPAYAHLNHAGRIGSHDSYSRGSWIPLIRPHFGERSYSDPPRYLPVELSRFDGAALPPLGIELYWGTVSETNNAGFHVERRTVDGDEEFRSLGFVQGAGTSTSPLAYDFLDQDVKHGKSYEYRLRQVDYDGTLDYSRSITLRYEFADELFISNSPNPFQTSTDIVFNLPFKAHVKLTIVDIMGRPLRSLFDGEMLPAAEQRIAWNGRDAQGRQLAAGTYFCRLQVGERTIVRSLNLLN